jgi:hypothetical protein
VKFARLAFLVLLAGAPASRAYVLNLNLLGNARHWNFFNPDSSISANVLNTNTHAIRFFLASDGWSATNTAAELDAVRAAFGQWQAVPGTYIKFEDAGLVSPPVDVNTSDNTNVIYWAKSSTLVNGGHDSIANALGVTFITFTTDTGEILQGDIVFNGVQYQWFTDFFNTSNQNTFVEGVALHETGHFLGLAHSPVGGATMLYHGGPGVTVLDGLSSDETAAARCLYPTAPTNYGAVHGLVTKDGNPVFGAAVFAEDSSDNVFAGTVTWTDGTYAISAVPPGTYGIRVAPLDPAGATAWLCRGRDIISATNYADYTTVDTTFLPTINTPVTVTANHTNTANFAVVNAGPAFSITSIRLPTSDTGSYEWGSLPANMRVGQSNYVIGVASATLPASGATLTITGDGLTLGSPTFDPNLGGLGLNFISVPISVSSNATPGLRDFIVQEGTNVAYANGFLEIQPAVLDYNFDGLDDVFQRTYFSPFTSAQAAPGADPDGDGMNNLAEYIAGTIPTNAASVLKMLAPTNGPGGATVRWQSVVGKRYQVFSRTNVAAGAWQTNGSLVTATNTTAQYLDATATNGARYYRVQVLP